MPETLAAAFDIYNAAIAFAIADKEYCDADDAMTGTFHQQGNSDMWARYEAAQDKLNEARRTLLALCGTRINAVIHKRDHANDAFAWFGVAHGTEDEPALD